MYINEFLEQLTIHAYGSLILNFIKRFDEKRLSSPVILNFILVFSCLTVVIKNIKTRGYCIPIEDIIHND